MVNHWGRNEWPAGHEKYFWYLTFEDPELVEMAANCQAQLKVAGIDLVPLNGLHITVLRIASSADITEASIQAIVDCAKKRISEVSTFRITVGPLSGSQGAVRFTVSPWTELFKLHQIVRESTLQALPELMLTDTDNFRPHLGVGYSNCQQSADSIIEKVLQTRDITPVTIEVSSIKLVRLRRESKAYRWNDVATLDFDPS
ncbi:2'-5' RNA ligase family protein [Nocardia huaxiensis]|uniref:2'-5' RNA ligase family protein n=1 Tax=Nocardia huaxiensis TaxID=2755382 RepID=A0A7D6VFM5_9NOCA|nr:2'-5' RNA ligase family protein [Nocardia huaxiensis]QLY33953.1 2'-5' RNA ligase family protein [Nocardia huaxiensis]